MRLDLPANSKPKKTKKNGGMKTDLHEDNGQVVDVTTKTVLDPWNPYFPLWPPEIPPNLGLNGAICFIEDWKMKRMAYLASYRSTCVINADYTPKAKNIEFYGMTYRLLEPILEKDSRCCFLRLFVKRMHRLISGFIITPETLNCVIIKNAMRCAKVILEGQAPEFGGFRANPNCMNQYGYFPLHEAAESFSVDMIKLLICHGALANLRTSGKNVKEGLLPLHVAVENTCLRKYLEKICFLIRSIQITARKISTKLSIFCAYLRCCPYTLPMPNKEVPDKSGSSVASKATTDVPYLLAVKKKVRHNSYIPTSVGSCFM
uniref:Uncharacterized protein n=1 Tax=Oryza glaberrima TaxID=4538 RepID=I1PS27_ORYGL